MSLDEAKTLQAQFRDTSIGVTFDEKSRLISSIPRTAWIEAGGRGTEWDYAATIETVCADEFEFGAVKVRERDGILAAAPVFRLDYRFDEALGPWFRSIGNALYALRPSLVSMSVLTMGSPYMDECPLSLGGALTEQAERFDRLLADMAAEAAACGAQMLAIKDLTDWRAHALHDVLIRNGFSRIESLPVASLDVGFDDIKSYLRSLSKNMREDLRRKRRQSAFTVRTEIRDNLVGIEKPIAELYSQTMARRKFHADKFDSAPTALLAAVMDRAGGRAKILLCWVGDRLAAFNIFVEEGHRVVGMHFGMDYELARPHNLYFVNWLAMVEYCIGIGCKTLQVGQTAYAVKIKLGCRLHHSWVYFKHLGPVRGPLFRVLAPLASFAQKDPELRDLDESAHYF